ncbi:MAG TPA: FAD-dependent oxidoreductase, partial [Chitinophagaceae bacterium]
AITVSLGQLQKGAITFSPPIDSKNNAFQQIGWGTAVRILLEFRSAFWEEKYSRLGFILSEEAVPTWWTQAPSEFPLLTGWAGGPQAVRLLDRTNEEILDVALESLSGIFSEPVTVLRDMLKASAIANWHRFEHFSGAYSYSLVGTMAAVNELRSPVDDTIFFVGEACYHGPSPGTVEAALVSARDVAASIVEKMERSS